MLLQFKNSSIIYKILKEVKLLFVYLFMREGQEEVC